jgi:hypothetical protein
MVRRAVRSCRLEAVSLFKETTMNKLSSFGAALLLAATALPFAAHAKLPAPSPEAKAKADEAKAKAAHGDKIGAYKLCLSMDRTAEHYYKTVGTSARPATPTPPCADPGVYVAAAPATATPPLEAAGAHSPPKTVVAPPSGKATSAEQTGTPKK